ncbi:MAG: hypothetical protein FWF28_05985 [Micrococcales bacterium]|nr:hypothetical protein [Micrococcales bacterium]
MTAIVDLVEMSGGAVVEPAPTVFDAEDHEHNPVMDLAVATDATLVVSNDTDLTALGPWRGCLPILRPRDFAVRMVTTRRNR